MVKDIKSILAFDLGTKCGWAAMCNLGTDSGVEVFTPAPKKRRKKTDPIPEEKEHYGKRIHLFNMFVHEIVQEYLPDIVYYEMIWNHGTDGILASHLYGAFEGVLSMLCFEEGIPIIRVGPGEIKKFATGNGAAKKPLMIRAATKKFGWTLTGGEKIQDNEADAICLLEFAKAKHGLTTP